jgi:hypothetical protein
VRLNGRTQREERFTSLLQVPWEMAPVAHHLILLVQLALRFNLRLPLHQVAIRFIFAQVRIQSVLVSK